MVDGEEGTEEWLPINALTPGEVPAGPDRDGDLDMELAQGTNPAEACAVELTLLEQAQKEIEEQAQKLDQQYKDVMARQGLLKNAPSTELFTGTCSYC